MTIPAIPVMLSLGLGVAILTACAAQSTACAGQCNAPYELMVDFRSGLTAAEGKAELTRCSNDPVVVRIETETLGGTGEVRGRVFTTVFGNTVSTQPLRTCLGRQHDITNFDWPV